MTKKLLPRLAVFSVFAVFAGYTWWASRWMTETPLSIHPSTISEIEDRQGEVYFLPRRDTHIPLTLPFVKYSPESPLYPVVLYKEALQGSYPEISMGKRAAELEKFGSEISYERWQELLDEYENQFTLYREQRLFQTDVIQQNEARQSQLNLIRNKIANSKQLSYSQKENLVTDLTALSEASELLSIDPTATSSALFGIDQLHRDEEFGIFQIMADHEPYILRTTLSTLEYDRGAVREVSSQRPNSEFLVQPSSLFLRVEASTSSQLFTPPPMLRVQRVDRTAVPEIAHRETLLFEQVYTSSNISNRDFSLLQQSMPYLWQLQREKESSTITASFLPGKIATKAVNMSALGLMVAGASLLLRKRVKELGDRWADRLRELSVFERPVPYLRFHVAGAAVMAGLTGVLLVLNTYRSLMHTLLFVTIILLAIIYPRLKSLSLLSVPIFFVTYVLGIVFFPWINANPILHVMLLIWVAVVGVELLETQFFSTRKFSPHVFREDLQVFQLEAQRLIQYIGRGRVLVLLLLLFGMIHTYFIGKHVLFVVDWLAEGTIGLVVRSLIWVAVLIAIYGAICVVFVWKSKQLRLPGIVFVLFLSIFLALQVLNYSEESIKRFPIILDVAPETAAIWDEVNIRGRNFHDLPYEGKVLLNGKEQRILRWNDSRVIFVIDPNTSSSGDIQLVRYDGVMVNAGKVVVGER